MFPSVLSQRTNYTFSCDNIVRKCTQVQAGIRCCSAQCTIVLRSIVQFGLVVYCAIVALVAFSDFHPTPAPTPTGDSPFIPCRTAGRCHVSFSFAHLPPPSPFLTRAVLLRLCADRSVGPTVLSGGCCRSVHVVHVVVLRTT